MLPEDWECCSGGCGDACVWQIYYRKKAMHEAMQQNSDTAEQK
ncbi:hypothetical protein [Stenoxybacter acetivorans]|nr:hypothetical protein [Stenoxybacter acetivorans]